MIGEWKCAECGHVYSAKQLLVARHPFIPEEHVVGCPDCKEVNTMTLLCDSPGCDRPAGCGTPTPEGYKHTCYEHRPNKEGE